MSQLLRLYIDADVLFRAVTRSHERTAAYVVLKLADMTLVETLTAHYAFHEAMRNVQVQAPKSAAELLDIGRHSLRIVDDPPAPMLLSVRDQAHPKDVLNLAAAQAAGAPLLITFNTRHYFLRTASVRVMTPGDFIVATRTRLALAWRNSP